MSSGDRDVTRTDLDRLADPPPIGELVAGTKIGRYVVERRLGEGGMGIVYAVWDSELARDVALKIVRPRTDIGAMQARLRREAQAMARLSHGNVVPVFDIGTHDGQLFLAMELIAGEPLRAWVDRPRPWRQVAQVFAKAGRGLAAAHAAGLVHRDFKPDNVVVDRSGEPRITDFGLARELAVEEVAPGPLAAGPQRELAQITAIGTLAGTLAYMAPEQLRGDQSDAQADQFSYCVSLFEVLCGARPFRAESSTPDAWIAEIRGGRIAQPAAARDVPGWLHATILRGLAFDPAQRWPSMLALVGAIDRGLRRRRRLANGLAAAVAVAVAGVGVMVSRASSPAPAAAPGCLAVAPKGNDAATIVVCKDEYARTSDPRVGAQLADALRRTRKLADAATVATELLATPARADALYTLGKIAAAEDRPDEALRSLRLAGEIHRDQQQWGDAAADLLAAAEFSSDFVDQLVDLDRAVTDARRAGARTTEAYGRIAAAVVLSEIGVRAGALGELARAEPLVTRPSEQVGLSLERGNVHQNLGEHALAVAAFEHALVNAEAVTIARRALSARLNLAYSLAESDRLADAASQLSAAAALDPGDRKLVIRLSLEAQIAARGGDPVRAAGLVDRALAASDPDVPEDMLELEVQRAEIALQHGELAVAEAWARRAIASIAKLRSPHPPVELRSWMVVDRRIPYEILFASLAGRGDAGGALVVFDRYRGLAALDGLARGEGGAATLPGVGFPVAELARLLPPLQASALAAPADDQAVLDAVRARSLLALVVAHGELWRITAEGGRLEVARIGPLAALRAQLDRIRAAPDDHAAAVALGDLLVPAALARPSDQVLHVVLDEPLAWLPVAALRVGGRPLIAARPIVRAVRASALGCMPRPRGPRRVVRLDARDATRGALFGVAPGERLDLAVPIEPSALGDALVLKDGRVQALEIAGHGGAAAQVVIMAPGAAPGAGPAGAAALATAFVAAGADQVIAAVRPVSSATLERLAERLERADQGDLARALARLQRAGGEEDWLGLAAFGRAACDPQP